jgi:hypothetical protein
MAIIRGLKHQPLERDARHTEAAATYCVIEDEAGVRYLQIDTYGSTDRKLRGKKSQSVRLAPEAIAELRNILTRFF